MSWIFAAVSKEPYHVVLIRLHLIIVEGVSIELAAEDDDQQIDEADEYDEGSVGSPEAADAEILTDNCIVVVVDNDTVVTCHAQTVIANALDKCRRLVKLINKSSILSGFIQRLKIENKVNRSLTIDYKSQWSSTY